MRLHHYYHDDDDNDDDDDHDTALPGEETPEWRARFVTTVIGIADPSSAGHLPIGLPGHGPFVEAEERPAAGKDREARVSRHGARFTIYVLGAV